MFSSDHDTNKASGVHGFAAPGFGGVVDAFRENFAAGEELGASFCVWADGVPIISLWGGFADRKQTQPWREDSMACIFSSGKAVLSLLAAHAVDQNLIKYDAPIATYWPEFAAAGKSAITVEDVLSHRAGLCGFADPIDPALWLDWPGLCAAIAQMEPLWQNRGANGYHPQTVGFIIGEVLRRACNKSVGTLIDELQVGQAQKVYCGTPIEAQSRAVFMPKPPRAPDLGDMNEFKRHAFLQKWSSPASTDAAAWMAAQIPGSNMHGNAQALAKLLHDYANPGHLAGVRGFGLSKSAVDQALATRIEGQDLVLPFNLSWSAGLMKNINGHFGPSADAFGHAGFGGSCVVIDPAQKLSAAYVMNKMSPFLVGDPRADRLLTALYGCL